MTGSGYRTLLDLAVGAMLLTAVLIVWRRQLRALVRLLAVQGAALAAVPAISGAYSRDAQLVAVAAAVFALRALAFPLLLTRLARAEPDEREAEPLLATAAALIVTGLLLAAAYGVARPVVALSASPAVRAAPAAIAVVLTALFVLVTRRHALAQVVGVLMLDNGVAALAFLTTGGVPLIVELGVSFDVLLALLVLLVLVGRMRIAFGGADIAELRELRD